MPTAAILVAAGPGTRLQAGAPKAFVPLAGAPLFIHSLRALQAARVVTDIVIVVPRGATKQAARIAAENGTWRIEPRFVEGGSERQDSVRAGLTQVRDARLIAVHDAARPFVTPALIEAVVSVAARHGAAIAAVQVADTVKLADDEMCVGSTIPRQRVWLAQTPQVFRTDWIVAAHERALANGEEATDDAILVERMGFPVRIVPGDASNRKITNPEDRLWAEWWSSTHPRPREMA